MDPMTHAIREENQGILRLRDLVKALRQVPLHSDQSCPIVFVPGFSGWGRPLLGSFNYFGGFENLPLVLSNLGYIVIVVRIGPISTNHERACEIFAQLRRINAGGPG
ncbi:alpha/beta-hydrolase [Apiospora saccharicola]|uniref:Alpha/beta-hydrolase n=1 Tax=Apiospora saccharicola TaxID=335842 RepID=A0ABR1W0S2_9PEZI